MKPTEEQKAIVEKATLGGHLKINAGAGCTKTTTLSLISQAIEKPSLLLVFNKAAQLDCVSRFPPWVEVRTTHSVAYQAIGCMYQHKLRRPKGPYKNVAGSGKEVATFYDIKPLRGKTKIISAAALGLLVKNVVACYEQSADELITEAHIPPYVKDICRVYGVKLSVLGKSLVQWARALWKDRIDTASEVLATHDTYMKLFQLSKPDLGKEVIYLDEAHDTSRCTLDIVRNQEPHSQVILVGDKNQNIYSWRGSINAMKEVDYEDMVLSVAFRYGQELADLACKILNDGTIIKSGATYSTEVGEDVVDLERPYTVLYRTNGNLIMDAVGIILDGNCHKSLNLEIDTSDFCRLLESARHLKDGATFKVKHEDVLCFSCWQDLKDEAESNPEMKRVAAIVEARKDRQVIMALNSHSNSHEPDITFTTAHKSKGREWDQVILASDYPSNYEKNKWVGLAEGEKNLLYVASTRARKALNTNETVEEIMFHGEKGLSKEGDCLLLRAKLGDPAKGPVGKLEYEVADYEDWLEIGEAGREGNPQFMPNVG